MLASSLVSHDEFDLNNKSNKETQQTKSLDFKNTLKTKGFKLQIFFLAHLQSDLHISEMKFIQPTKRRKSIIIQQK